MAKSDSKKKTALQILPVPKGISRTSGMYWRRLVKSLDLLGQVEETDRHLLELTVATYEEWQISHKDVMKNGTVLKATSGRGYEIAKANPAAAVMSQAATRLLHCLRHLGLTPSSRRKGGNSGDDEIGDLLNG